jgi:hypothetical protein
MAATPMMSIIAAKAALDAVTALLSGTGSLVIRTGALEATTLTADAGSAAATLTLNSTAFPTNSTSTTTNGLATATANAITSDTNAAGGTAAHFRMKNGAGTVILQGTVGTATSDLIINTVTITAGDTVACSSFKVTLPCGDGVS